MMNMSMMSSGIRANHHLVSRNETMTLSDYDEARYKNSNLNTSNISII
jgi:hypothetical protein